MQSRASFFDRGLFRKAMSRFAPLWGGYTLCLLLGTLILVDGNIEHSLAFNLVSMIQGMAVINLGYGFLAAQLLFGDLFSTRMCYGLHSLPQRRECFLLTHLGAGLLFSLIPTAIMTAVCMPLIAAMSSMVSGWQIPLWFFLAANVQYLFFFTLGTVCMLCSGSRVGAAIVYGIVNFLSYLAYFLADQVYAPMLYGVVLTEQAFRFLCPVVMLCQLEPLETYRHSEKLGLNAFGNQEYRYWGTFEVIPSEWAYYGVLAAGAVVLVFIALWLYRRRRLECAGDIMASRKLESPFMVLFSITAAVLFQLLSGIFLGTDTQLLFLAAGLALGWFAGRMLIERQIRVFRQKKNWLCLTALLAVLGLSLWVNQRDPLNITGKIPQPEDVRRYAVSVRGYGNEVTNQDQLEAALALHALALEEHLTQEAIDREQAVLYEAATEAMESKDVPEYRRHVTLLFHYQLKNGWIIQREYPVWVDSTAGQEAERLLNALEAVLHPEITTPEQALALVGNVRSLRVEGMDLPDAATTDLAMEALLRAVIADCQAGTLAQDYNFHRDNGYLLGDGENGLRSVSVLFRSKDETKRYYFDVYADSENCKAWLETYGILDLVYEEYHLGEKFG